MKSFKRCFIFLLVFCLLSSSFCFAKEDKSLKNQLKKTAAYLTKNNKKPAINSSDWIIIGLSRSEVSVPRGYFDKYYKSVEKTVIEKKGILHEKKYTEYSRIIVALSAMGKDPKNVAGYNLLKPLGDFEKTIWQGINGPIWALIALDSKDYEIPECETAKVQATRQLYIDHILKKQQKDGGWDFIEKENSDPDLTAMALVALSRYKEQEKVALAIEKALNCLSALQLENGSFSSYGSENSESIAQVITALCSLEISINDERFVKNGKNLQEALLSFVKKDGSFSHLLYGKSNPIATEQAFYALTALWRLKENKSNLYDMKE